MTAILDKIELLKRKRELKELILIEKAKSNLLAFIMLCFPEFYDAQWYHKYICGVFDKFARNEINRLMVFMPPQHGKSTMMTEYLPAYLLGRNPDEKIMLCAYNSELSATFNRKVQRVISGENYSKVFPETLLNDKNVVSDSKGTYIRNSSEFEIVGHTGFLKAASVGSGIAGRPAKTALLDDVIKNVDEGNSPTYRKKIYDWYTDELEARLHNDSKVAFTITRRHEDDLAGRLIKRDGVVEDGGQWTVIKLPALKEDNSNPNDIREIGEALWESKHSRKRMEDRRDKAPRTFASLYQQRPAPLEGGMIKRDWFPRYNEHEIDWTKVTTHFYLDTAYTEKQKNDPSAILAFAVIKDRLYLRHCKTVRMEFPDLVEFIPRYIELYGNPRSGVIIEPKASGLSVIQTLRRETSLNIIQDDPPKDSKVTRVSGVTTILEGGRVLVPEVGEWVTLFLDECAVFPNGLHDDRVDCLVGAINKTLVKIQKAGGFQAGWA